MKASSILMLKPTPTSASPSARSAKRPFSVAAASAQAAPSRVISRMASVWFSRWTATAMGVIASVNAATVAATAPQARRTST